MENSKTDDSIPADANATITLLGTVEKVIPSVGPRVPEKAQIAIEGADHLYREVRVDNTLQDGGGEEVALKLGAEVNVTIEAAPGATTPKQSTSPMESSQVAKPGDKK